MPTRKWLAEAAEHYEKALPVLARMDLAQTEEELDDIDEIDVIKAAGHLLFAFVASNIAIAKSTRGTP